MNNKLNQNFSLRKLLLSAFVAGPLAVLPAPLWALPDTAGSNLTTSSGVTLAGVTNGGTGTLNINAPDKAILTWGSFNIGALDTVNYLLPGGSVSSASVLNNVTGGASTISGNIISNGNVYLLNPAGIILSKTASINTGGFYASTISEPSSFFSTTGTLNFNGSSTADVVLQADIATAPTIQAVGTGNNIVLAGRSVLVEGANFFGNVKLQSTPTITSGVVTAGAINLAQTSSGDLQAGGNVNVNKINGLGGNLTIVSNGAPVSLTGTALAVTPVITVTPTGQLSIANPVTPAGSGYTPNSTLALSITAPVIRQGLNSSTTASSSVGVTAVGTATTDAQGRIVSYNLTNAGQGYISTTGGLLASPVAGNVTIGQNITATPSQVGFATTVAGNTSIDTTAGAVNGAVSQPGGRFTSTGAATITTGNASNSPAAGSVTLSSSNLSTISFPVAVGNVNILEVDGFTVGASKIFPSANAGVQFRATAGNISTASGTRVDVIPSVAAPAPTINLIANAGGITYSGNGSVTIGTLTTTTGSAGIANITATGNITIPGYSNPGLILTTTGGDITTGALSSTQGAANQVSPTITASGNVAINGNINTTGRVAINAGGTLTITGSNTAPATAGAGLNLKSVGDLTFSGSSSLSAGTDVAIESTTGSVTIPGGFSGAGSITAAQNVSIGTSASARGNASFGTSFVVETSNGVTQTFKFGSGSVSNQGGLYAPNTTLPLVMNATGATVQPTGFVTTNGSGQITSVTVTNPGAGITQTNGTLNVTVSLATPSSANAIVSGGNLNLRATGGTVTLGGSVTGTGNVSITSANSVTTPSITAPTVLLTSTAGSIAQNAGSAITSSGTATLNAATSVTLDNAGNDFGTVVVLNSPSGATIKDANAIVVGNGTDAKGNLTVTSGAGLTANAGTPGITNIAITGNNIDAKAGLGAIAGGSVTSVPLTVTGAGYTPNTQIPLTFTPAPVKTPSGTVLVNSASTVQNVSGYVIAPVGSAASALAAVVLNSPIGYGFTPNSTVALNVNATATTAPTAVGITNGNGQISSIQVTNPGACVTAITSITTAVDANNIGVANTNAAGYLNIGADGRPTGIVITNGGDGYIFQPSVTGIPAAASAVATFTPTFNAGNAVTGIIQPTTPVATANQLVGGANYIASQTIPAANGLPAFTTVVNNGVITNVVPVATGGIQLGSAVTDVIKVAGGLTLTSSGPAGSFTNPVTGLTNSYSVVGTTANSVAVTGAASLNTSGADATFGVVGAIGTTPSVNAASVGGSVGAGTLTIRQDGNLTLAAVTAGSLKATSVTGNISNSGKLAISGTSEFVANTIFAPGTINLSDATSTFGGTISIINGKDVVVNSANGPTQLAPFTADTQVVIGSATQNGIVSGSTTVLAPASGVNISVAGNGNLSKVGFSAGSNVTISDGTNTDGLTIENATNTGTGTVNVTIAGPITLGSGIKLNSTGRTTFDATGAGGTIKDSGASASAFGPVTFRSSNDISITATGHSFGPVTLSSGFNNAPDVNGVVQAKKTDIVYTEAGTARIENLNVGNNSNLSGSLTVTSTAGSIDKLGNNLSVFNPGNVTTTSIVFSAPNGSVVLDGNNAWFAPISITASGNSSIRGANTNDLVFGNVAVTNGTFSATNATSGFKVSQAADTAIRVYGETTVNSTGGAISLGNTGNNFGALTLNSTFTASTASITAVVNAAGAITGFTVNNSGWGFPRNSTTVPVTLPGGGTATANTNTFGQITSVNLGSVAGVPVYPASTNQTASVVASVAAAGANVTVKEAGTLNLRSVNTGTAGDLSVTSDNAAVISSALPLFVSNVTVGGNTTINAKTDVALDTTNVTNNFGGKPIVITAAGNVTLQDVNATTVIAGGTNIGGSLSVRNTAAAGQIKDSAGVLNVFGAVSLVTSNTGSIKIDSSTASLGAVKFNTGSVTIAESQTLNLAAGSTTNGAASLSSNVDIVTSGIGGGSFTGTLTLSANGKIAITNPIFVSGGLTYRALGSVDLKALSITGNLNSIVPVNLNPGSTVIPPSP